MNEQNANSSGTNTALLVTVIVLLLIVIGGGLAYWAYQGSREEPRQEIRIETPDNEPAEPAPGTPEQTEPPAGDGATPPATE